MKTTLGLLKWVIAAIIAVFMLWGCSSTKVLSSWMLDSPPANSLNKVLVLAIIHDRQLKENLENQMARELVAARINAATATSVFGPKDFRGMTEEQISARMKQAGYSAIILLSLVDKEYDRSYTPGMVYASPRTMGYNRYYRRYVYAYDRIYTPGYYRSSTNYVLQADIYTTNEDDALIYSAQTQSYDPTSKESLAEGFAKAIVADLRTKGLIGLQ